MTDFTALLAQGTTSAWFFIPTAILLGALHGLEPGHSKTLMAAFIIAVRGTLGQAVLLGLSATVSHTLIVWVVALGGMVLWQGVDPEQTEPYFQLASGIAIIALALWMLWRTYDGQRTRHGAQGHSQDHSHGHHHGHDHAHHDHHHHDHDHGHHHQADAPGDAHARAHARDIEKRFGGSGSVTTWQIIAFGLTGGLIPCPAAITVLLLCLQVQEIALGAAIVLAFSVGLAATLVIVGAVAALGVAQINKRSGLFSTLARRAPYFSGVLIILVGLYVTLHGWQGLAAQREAESIRSAAAVVSETLDRV